jgi:hypothetical protein
MRLRTIAILVILLAAGRSGFAQQRPLVTEDPETVGSGLILIEGGVEYQKDLFYPVSGLTGNLLRIGTLGVSFGISSIAELQIDGGVYQQLSITEQVRAPLTPLLDISGTKTSSIRDLLVGTKVQLLGERPGRPALGARFATRLPMASLESGLGRETTDFTAAFLIGKTVQSVRVVGNVGFLMLEDPIAPSQQDTLMTYAVSFARAVAEGFELVGEVNGRINFGDVDPLGAETRGFGRFGARYTRGSVRVDGAFLLGLSPRDPDWGITGGLTWVVDAFRVP